MKPKFLITLLILCLGIVLGLLLRPHFSKFIQKIRPSQSQLRAINRQAQFVRLKGVDTRPKVVFWGDSILREINLSEWFVCHNTQVVNRAIGGELAQELVKRIKDVPSQARQNFVLSGINDIEQRRNPKQIVQNIHTMAQELNTHNAEVYVISILPTRVPAWNKHAKSVNALLKSSAAKGYVFVDLYDSFLGEDGLLSASFTYDRAHLTPAGIDALVSGLASYMRDC